MEYKTVIQSNTINILFNSFIINLTQLIFNSIHNQSNKVNIHIQSNTVNIQSNTINIHNQSNTVIIQFNSIHNPSNKVNIQL